MQKRNIHITVRTIKSKIKWQYLFNTESLCFNNLTNPIEIRYWFKRRSLILWQLIAFFLIERRISFESVGNIWLPKVSKMICKKEVILFIIYACLQQFAANHIISHVLLEDSRKIQTGQTIPEE